MKKIKPFLWVLLGSFLFLNACKENVGTEEASLSRPFQGITEVQSLTLEWEGEDIIIVGSDESWESDQIPHLDQASVWQFVQNIVGMQGKKVDEKEVNLPDDHLLRFTIKDGAGKDWQASLYPDGTGGFYLEDQTYDQLLHIQQLPIELQVFDEVYLMPSIIYEIGKIQEITYEEGGDYFVINQDTNLSKVETAPFISGWYLHGAFETDFSMEYRQMEQVLAHLLELKGREVTQPKEWQEQLSITLDDGKRQEVLQFGKPGSETTLLHLEKADQWYEVPTLLANGLALDPFQLVDNFIALIPLDALTSVEIKTADETYLIEAEHELTTDHTGKPAISSQFKLDGVLMEESSFRKAYQYLAALQYYQENKEGMPIQTGDSEIQIHYLFQSEGERVEHVIQLYELDHEQYIVVKNDIQEFTANRAPFEEMLTEFAKLSSKN